MDKLPPRVRSAATTKKRTRSQFKRQNELRCDNDPSMKSVQDSRPQLNSKRRKLVKEQQTSSKLLQTRSSLTLKQKAIRMGQN